MGETLEFETRIIPQVMVGCRLHAVAEIDVVEPGREPFHLVTQDVGLEPGGRASRQDTRSLMAMIRAWASAISMVVHEAGSMSNESSRSMDTSR